ncbi:MAG TPA: pyrroloquinoline quinone-dependent dehydrogenase [Hyphomonadaceae bacterium]|jgi:quinoprotein glucose dehydrogenase|nr:pyrroloquinoline quinone-dependent dehydrogenase [Hyphomonadaceae bacterium]
MRMGNVRNFGLAAMALAASSCASPASPREGDWPAFGRTHLGDRHSPLTQITPGNVAQLEAAWTYSTGEAAIETRSAFRLSTTPIVVDGAMYINTPLGKVAALNPVTGAQIWSRDFAVDRRGDFPDSASRGVSFWRDKAAAPGGPCATRIFVGVLDARLASLDARTGASCPDFGDGGVVNLKAGLRTGADPKWNAWEYELTSPPVIVGDLVIVGSTVGDNSRSRAASGEVRAFNARTGAQVWTFDPIPQDPNDPAYKTWSGPIAHQTGAANVWSVMAADPARDLVFLPTSSPSPDYWGGGRLGDNRYANSIVALRASTGKVVWHFQTVHHDIWDYDNAAPPALVTIERNGRKRDVVIQATKTGQLFVLDRENGEPVFAVEERPVPPSDVPGEVASPTQPFSAELPPLSPQALPKAWGATPEIEAACAAELAGLRNEGIFTPPSLKGSLILPGNVGGVNWGGVTYDPERGLAITAVNTIAAVVRLVPKDQRGRADFKAGGRLGDDGAIMLDAPYAMSRFFLATPKGEFCTPTPHGTLVAVDLRAGRIAWSVPLGMAPGQTAPDGKAEGMVNLGGAVTTASGVAFIGATPDGWFRAFDTASGRQLWQAKLPAGARATPMTYLGADGRQYVVIAAGGDGEGFGRSDQFVAFALPAPGRKVN